MPVMDLLKIGDLARRSGLTVRALHHFDQIGLLTPSARNDAGYRLYNRDDVARLHGIQALRQLGLPLKDIGSMLAGDSAALPMVVARQLQALDQQISQASQLRARLALLMDRFSVGAQPEIGEWLASLALMATYSRYFNPDEVRRIVINWQAVRAEWPPLMQAVRQMMDAGVPANDLAMQPLAHRWMGLIHHWLGGDFALIERWGRLFVQEPAVRQAGAPDLAMVAYVEQATALRLAAWLRHFTLADLAAFRWVSHGVWQALAGQVQALMAAGVPPGAAAARALAAQAGVLVDQAVGGDAVLRHKLDGALQAEPLLRAGALLTPAQMAYLRLDQRPSPAPDGLPDLLPDQSPDLPPDLPSHVLPDPPAAPQRHSAGAAVPRKPAGPRQKSA